MSAYWMWWIAAAALIGAEMLTGTFYLLAVGIAVACGGIAAWLGWSIPYQWLTAGVLGVAGVVALERWRRRRGGASRQPALDAARWFACRAGGRTAPRG